MNSGKNSQFPEQILQICNEFQHFFIKKMVGLGYFIMQFNNELTEYLEKNNQFAKGVR